MRSHSIRALMMLAILSVFTGFPSLLRGEQPAIEFKLETGRVVITSRGKPLATYVYADDKISRPYFAHVHGLGKAQLTRNHPPQQGDAQDHDLLHPGLWFALGDLSGHDNWRLKARVIGGEFLAKPTSDSQEGSFAVRNQYLSDNGLETVCREDCRYRFRPQPWGCLVLIDSTFTSVLDDCKFGDQMEEMGLAIRLATPLAVNSKQGGRILDSEGRVNERDVRERLANWCDYAGSLNGHPAGITLMADPGNPRRTWWHARDYGFVTANPFHAHPDRDQDQPLELQADQSVRFRFGIALHDESVGSEYDPKVAYAEFVSLFDKP